MSPEADTHGLNARLLKFRSHPEQEDAHALAEDLIAARRYGDARGVAVSAQTDEQAFDARLLVLEGRAWYLDRDLARAQAALVRAAKLDPYCAPAYRWLGEVLLKRGDPTRAERALERAHELEPDAQETERLLSRARQLSRHAQATDEAQQQQPAPRSTPLPEAPAARRVPTMSGATGPAAAKPRAVKPVFEAPKPAPVQRSSVAGRAAPRAAESQHHQPAEAPTTDQRRPLFDAERLAADAERDATFDELSAEEQHTGPTANGSLDAPRSSPGRFHSPVSEPLRELEPSRRTGTGTLAGHRTSAAGTQPAARRSTPGVTPSPLPRTSPGANASPLPRTSPGASASPLPRTSPGASASPLPRTSPGASASPPPRSSPGVTPSPLPRSSPGVTPSPLPRSSPGVTPSPLPRSSPGVTPSPLPRSSPGAFAAPVARSSSGEQAAPAGRASSSGHEPSPLRPSSSGHEPSPLRPSSSGHEPSPLRPSAYGTNGTHRSSSPGEEFAAPRSPTPVAQPAPAMSQARSGSRSSPGTLPGLRPSSPGSAPTPIAELLTHDPAGDGGSRASMRSSPGTQRAAQRSSSGGLAAAPVLPRSSPGLAAAPAAGLASGASASAQPLRPPQGLAQPGSTPGMARAPGRTEGSVVSTSLWDAPSVIASWPALEALGEGEEIDLAKVVPSEYALPEPGTESERPEPTEEPAPAAADLPVGDSAGQPDSAEALLRTLEAQGIFEPPEAVAPAFEQSAEVARARTGTRLRGTLLSVWLTSLALLGCGYLGWTQFIAARHARAAQLVTEARAAAFEGEHARLVDAERLLIEARDNHPRSLAIPSADLFVQAQRVLENGSRELSALGAALRRAEQRKAEDKTLAAYVGSARAVLDVYSGAASGAGKTLEQAAAAAGGEPALLYLIGRLEQRLGQAGATARLQAAAAAAPDLLAAEFALAELQYEQGDAAGALAHTDAILKRRPKHLRAQLFRLFLTADTEDPASALRTLDGLAKDARTEGAPVDRILWALSRARMLRRTGDLPKAGEALREALAAGTSEPRLLALLSTEAQRVGQLGVAQQAASQAVTAAPQAAAYRALLASILLERHEGDRAFQLLSDLPEGNPALVLMRARAALEIGDPTALRTSLTALEAEASEGASGSELAALRLRLRAALEPKSQMLAEAKSLLKRVPGDPEVLQALAEVALALREPREAVPALDQLVKFAPDDAEAHYLLGRARRMAADATGAEAAFRRALELASGHFGALSALGTLLLDSGKYAEADALFQQVASTNPLQGRLGRAEALIALRRLEDAQVQLSGLQEAQRALPSVRETAARLAIAQKQPGEALAQLRPLLEGEQKKAAVLVLQGDALYAADDVNGAAGAYEAALELDSALPEALIGRALVHLRAERPGEALELLDDAAEALQGRLRAPEMRARVLALQGRAYVQRDKRDDAERGRDLLRQAVKLPSPPAEAYFWLGEVLGGRKTPEAANALKRYLELEPKGDYAVRARRALGPLL